MDRRRIVREKSVTKCRGRDQVRDTFGLPEVLPVPCSERVVLEFQEHSLIYSFTERVSPPVWPSVGPTSPEPPESLPCHRDVRRRFVSPGVKGFPSLPSFIGRDDVLYLHPDGPRFYGTPLHCPLLEPIRRPQSMCSEELR